MRFYLTLVVLLLAASFVFAEEEWPSHMIDGVVQNDHIAPPVDFDNDGDLDLITYGLQDTEITAYLNDSAGNFSSVVLIDGLIAPRQVGIGDFDSDGDNDLAVVDFGVPEFTLYVFFNQGNNQFTQITVDSYEFLRHWMTVCDVDQDGAPDLLLPSPGGAKWFRYDGAGGFEGFAIDTGADLWWDHAMVDIDGDGDNDFIAQMTTNEEGVFWIENVGDTTFELRDMIHEGRVYGILVIDQNLDGVLDIVVHFLDGIWAYTYDDNIFTQHYISPNRDIMDMHVADLDLDGDEDFVYYSGHLHRAGWGQYLGGTQFKDQMIAGTPSDMDDLYLGDFDQDQDLDFVAVVSAWSPTHTLSWWENPNYQIGVNLTRSVDHSGLVTLKWADLNANAYQIKRDGVVLATIAGTQYNDQLADHLPHEYVVTANPQNPSSKPSYPVKAIWPDLDEIALLEDFNQGKPWSWSIEDNTATLTWETASLPAKFTSRCMSIGWHHVYRYELTDKWRGRLVTPGMLKTPTSRVELMFDQAILRTATILCNLEYSVDDGLSWQTFAQYHMAQENQQYYDLTYALTGHSRFKIGFYYDSTKGCNRWAVDNVTVIVDEQPVNLQLTPLQTIVPPSGGDLQYDATLISSFNLSFPDLSYWITVNLPGGQEFSRYEVESFDLAAFANYTMPGLVISVPESAPAGEYYITGYVGRPRSNVPIIQDQFLFEKLGDLGSVNSEFDPADWELTNNSATFTSAADSHTDLPTEFALNAAYPNPFNPTTTISVALPEAANLTVSVVNTLGQQVAELTHGRTAAGTHAFTFDASSLSSGIYFVHATVPGQLNAVQKVVLMK